MKQRHLIIMLAIFLTTSTYAEMIPNQPTTPPDYAPPSSMNSSGANQPPQQADQQTGAQPKIIDQNGSLKMLDSPNTSPSAPTSVTVPSAMPLPQGMHLPPGTQPPSGMQQGMQPPTSDMQPPPTMQQSMPQGMPSR